MSRVPEPEELADDLHDIKRQISALLVELKEGYVPRELYEARHLGLRNEIALELAAMKREAETTRTTASTSRNLSMWCLGILATSVIVALVGFVATGGAA